MEEEMYGSIVDGNIISSRYQDVIFFQRISVLFKWEIEGMGK